MNKIVPINLGNSKFLPIIISCTVLLLVKIITNIDFFYLNPNNIERPCHEFFNKKNIIQFNFNNNLSWFVPCLSNNKITLDYLDNHKTTDKIIVFCHGNSNNITWKERILDRLSDNFKYPIICQDYLRIDNCNINNMINNTCKLIEFLNKKGFNNDSIILFGESIGCHIILNVAKKYNIKNVICYIGFRKTSNIIKRKLPVIGHFVTLFIYDLNNEKIIKSFNNLNITFLNSPQDELVDYNDIKDMISQLEQSSNSNVAQAVSLLEKSSNSNLAVNDTKYELLEISGIHKKPTIPDNVFLRLKEKYDI